jgi:anti-sigma factor (TIGR02949 family)
MSHYNRLTCEETFRRLEDYVDRELNSEEMERVRLHLESCAGCAHEFAFQENVIRAVRSRLQRIAMPNDLLSRISQSLRKASDVSQE